MQQSFNDLQVKSYWKVFVFVFEFIWIISQLPKSQSRLRKHDIYQGWA